MIRDAKVDYFISGAVVAAIAAMALAFQFTPPFPGYWELGSFIFIAFLLDRTSLPLRVSARGSVSFIMHISGAILFGAFWGGVAAALSVAANQVVTGSSRRKTVFNVAQRVLSITIAVL